MFEGLESFCAFFNRGGVPGDVVVGEFFGGVFDPEFDDFLSILSFLKSEVVRFRGKPFCDVGFLVSSEVTTSYAFSDGCEHGVGNAFGVEIDSELLEVFVVFDSL